MFSVGDKIMYGGTGACVVEEITQVHAPNAEAPRSYYVLKPVYQSGTIQTPVNNDKIPIRPVLTRQEAERLVDSIPGVSACMCMEKNLSALRNHYRDQMSSFECIDLIRMTKSIYAKKKEAESRQKKIGLTDEKFLHRAEDLLYGELAIALEIPKDSVSEYIAHRLGGMENVTE